MLAAMLAAGGVLATLGLVGGAAIAAVPAVLVDEPFTGPSADAGFIGFDDACLTAAAALGAGDPPDGDHALAGCNPTRTGENPAVLSPPRGAGSDGYLQLTDSVDNRAGAVLYDTPIPNTQGVDVRFDQWQYGAGNDPFPADGISFFLVNGNVTLDQPGAFGGSLGYAQKFDTPLGTQFPGVTSGYLGIGLDVLGNYFNDLENRGLGCGTDGLPGTAVSPAGGGAGTPGSIATAGPNMVTVRGPGTGDQGYCFLAATYTGASGPAGWASTLAPNTLQGTPAAYDDTMSAAEFATALEPAMRSVHIIITPAPDAVVTVFIDFDGPGPAPEQQVLQFDAPPAMPESYKFGFAASTGQFDDVHLIRNVVVTSELPLPRLSLVKQIDGDAVLDDPLVVGSEVPFQYLVNNTGDTTISDLTVTDDTVAVIACPVTVLAPGASTVCTGTHTITQAELDAGFAINVAIAHGESEDGSDVDSNEDTETVPLPGVIGLILEKSAVDPDTVRSPGDVVQYEYQVFNDSTVPVTELGVIDDRIAGIVCELTTLAPRNEPGDRTSCRGSYTITEADAAAGAVHNVAVARGDDPEGGSVYSRPDTERVPAALPPATTPAAPPTSSAPAELPATGFDGGWIALGGVLALLGAVAISGVRSRRRV